MILQYYEDTLKQTVITIDGPAGSGKSTVSKRLAKMLGVVFLDTGAMYRAWTFAAIDKKADLEDVQQLLSVFENTKFTFEPQNSSTKVTIDATDRSEEIRLPQITNKVRYIASRPELRSKLVSMQREFAKQYGKIVTEGRDQGTVVFPDADVKIFLIADVEERARRRMIELKEKGENVSLEEIKKSIEARDDSDMQRKVGALKPAQDAVEVDTTGLSIEQVVDKLYEIVREKI